MRSAVVAILSGALLTGCALFRAPNLECKKCWHPEPCSGDWVTVSEESGGGCMLTIPAGRECSEFYPERYR